MTCRSVPCGVLQVDELSGKLMAKQDEIIDKQTKCMDATEALRKKEEEMKKMEGR